MELTRSRLIASTTCPFLDQRRTMCPARPAIIPSAVPQLPAPMIAMRLIKQESEHEESGVRRKTGFSHIF
jgi:hypothetical protein